MNVAKLPNLQFMLFMIFAGRIYRNVCDGSRMGIHGR